VKSGGKMLVMDEEGEVYVILDKYPTAFSLGKREDAIEHIKEVAEEEINLTNEDIMKIKEMTPIGIDEDW